MDFLEFHVFGELGTDPSMLHHDGWILHPNAMAQQQWQLLGGACGSSSRVTLTSTQPPQLSSINLLAEINCNCICIDKWQYFRKLVHCQLFAQLRVFMSWIPSLAPREHSWWEVLAMTYCFSYGGCPICLLGDATKERSLRLYLKSWISACKLQLFFKCKP